MLVTMSHDIWSASSCLSIILRTSYMLLDIVREGGDFDRPRVGYRIFI